jgi:hypothetical protein
VLLLLLLLLLRRGGEGRDGRVGGDVLQVLVQERGVPRVQQQRAREVDGAAANLVRRRVLAAVFACGQTGHNAASVWTRHVPAECVLVVPEYREPSQLALTGRTVVAKSPEGRVRPAGRDGVRRGVFVVKINASAL